MGNQCCAGDNLNENETSFKAGNNPSRENLKSSMNDKDHLPLETSHDYTKFLSNAPGVPPQLTKEAEHVDKQSTGAVNNNNNKTAQNYPTSTNFYLINSTNEIYRGQFFNRLPHGYGEIYEPTAIQGAQDFGLAGVNKGNTSVGNGVAGITNNSTAYSSNKQATGNQQYIKYVGFFQNGKKSGQGRAIYPDGSSYTGNWENNLPSGYGRLQSHTAGAQQEFYDGQWKDGLTHGLGTQQWRDGTKYNGYFAKGKKDGKGVFTWLDGNKYDGEYKEDLRSGKGIFTW